MAASPYAVRRLAIAACVLFTARSVLSQTVHPATETVPANLLRLSVVFLNQQPASVGLAIHLTTAAGINVPGAFYPEPLWSPDQRTLTLYLDPGRVKTGLRSRDTTGPVLEVGRPVSVRFGDVVLHTWTVTPPRTELLRPDAAVRGDPRRETRDAISLGFATPIDWQSRGLIAVAGPGGHRVDGVESLGAGETRWTFVPAIPWVGGQYTVRINEDLEDPEGNRVQAAFETRAGEMGPSGPNVDRSFVVR